VARRLWDVGRVLGRASCKLSREHLRFSRTATYKHMAGSRISSVVPPPHPKPRSQKARRAAHGSAVNDRREHRVDAGQLGKPFLDARGSSFGSCGVLVYDSKSHLPSADVIPGAEAPRSAWGRPGIDILIGSERPSINPKPRIASELCQAFSRA
jgi:hypothetical protein